MMVERCSSMKGMRYNGPPEWWYIGGLEFLSCVNMVWRCGGHAVWPSCGHLVERRGSAAKCRCVGEMELPSCVM